MPANAENLVVRIQWIGGASTAQDRPEQKRGRRTNAMRHWVLYERRYAFEWLDGLQDWDEVTCDS